MILDDEGRFVHTFRQSQINTFDLCPERARLSERFRRETDAASVGTATHAAIEHALAAWHDAQPISVEELLEVAHRELDSIDYEPVKWANDDTARRFLDTCVRNFYELVLATLPTVALLEVPFDLVFHEDATRVIRLSGRMDYVPGSLDLDDCVRDWKTAGRKYQTWEYERWAIQPTVYTWAAHEMGLVREIDPDFEVHHVPFEYVVLGAHGVQRFTVARTPTDWEWLRDKVVAMAVLAEADLAVWPRQDNHTLCSAKWCDAWSACKGQMRG